MICLLYANDDCTTADLTQTGKDYTVVQPPGILNWNGAFVYSSFMCAAITQAQYNAAIKSASSASVAATASKSKSKSKREADPEPTPPGPPPALASEIAKQRMKPKVGVVKGESKRAAELEPEQGDKELWNELTRQKGESAGHLGADR